MQAVDGGHPTWNRLGLFVCPTCRAGLSERDGLVACEAGHEFPLVGDKAVLIGEGSSFVPGDVAATKASYFDARARESARKGEWRRRLPAPGRNIRGAFVAPAQQIVAEVAEGRTPVGLLLGCGERGASRTERFAGVDWILTDVDLNYAAEAAADVTSLPLPDGSVDIVLVEHVLEHVLDPLRGAAEIERVLRVGGVVVAVVPFSFPWHGAPIDYFRVTPSGMRVLFRSCAVEHLGAGMGGGSALSYGAVATVAGIPVSRTWRRVALVLSRLLLTPIKYLDQLEERRGKALTFAAEYQFVGRKLEEPLTDRELLDDVRARFG
ncbi:MAG TPA: methyltransferase domain-containing protein [Acidimicrobiales bacterium]|nr:methyltransferase domain-containing protein [Acidimicrobiales bacterium]